MLSEPLSEGFDDGVATFGGQGSHVEDAADGLTSAGDGAFTLEGAAISIEGSQADESRDLLAVQLAKFGDIGDDGGGGDAPQAGHRLDELSFVAPVIVGLDDGFDGLFDVADLGFQGVEHGLDALPGGLSSGDMPAIGLLGAKVDELPPAGDKLLDFGLFFGSFLDGGGLHLLSEESQDPGIDAIGLGHQAQGPGEVAGPFGIDNRDAVAGIEEVGYDFALVAAGGFEDDETGGRIGEQLTELLVSCFGVGQVVGLPGGEEVEIERGLGDVDSDRNLVRAIHGEFPFLPMRARAAFGAATAQATVRVCFQRPATIQLRDGVVSTEARSICRRFFRGWLRSQPRNREH